MTPGTYLTFLRHAQRQSRRAGEAEDLLQSALLAAVEAGRADLTLPDNRRWLTGTIRKLAAFQARSALRRRSREQSVDVSPPAKPPCPLPTVFLTTLPPSLRQTALLSLTGHTRAEIAYLLDLSGTALRQRICQIRQRWIAAGDQDIDALPGLSHLLPYGLMRRALRYSVQHIDAHLGSHDPDGHLFVLGHAHKTVGHGNMVV